MYKNNILKPTCMKTTKILYPLVFIIFLFSIITKSSCQDDYDIVNGNLIQFSDNGAWCWHQDERVIIDTASGKLIFGSDLFQ